MLFEETLHNLDSALVLDGQVCKVGEILHIKVNCGYFIIIAVNMGGYQSQLYLLKDIKEHECDKCKITDKLCYRHKERPELLVSSLEEVYESSHHLYEKFKYQIRTCDHYMKKTDQQTSFGSFGDTKVTVDVGYSSCINTEILGKMIYSSDVNLYSISANDLDPRTIPCHRELGQASGDNLRIMYNNRHLFGKLFKDVTPEMLNKCHLFVKNTGPMLWGNDHHIGKTNLESRADNKFADEDSSDDD